MGHVALPVAFVAGFALFVTVGCNQSSDATNLPIDVTTEVSGEQGRPVSFRERLGRLKYERDRLVRTVEHLERDRAETIKRLRSLGISTSSDLAGHPTAKVDAQELTEVVGQIQQLKSLISDYEAAIHRVEVVIRQHDRNVRLERSAPSEVELDRLSSAFHEAEEVLRPHPEKSIVDDLRMEQILDAELGQIQ